MDWLEEHIRDDKIVALGEIGLDYHYDNTDKEQENYVFKKQLEIARKHNKPVIIHSRDAIQDTYNILKEYNVRGCLHCYSGSLEIAREFVKLGFLLGVGGVITFKNAKNIVNVIKNIDLEYILLETDAPYLSPAPVRRETNDSRNIIYVAENLTKIKGLKIEDVLRINKENVNRLFGI